MWRSPRSLAARRHGQRRPRSGPASAVGLLLVSVLACAVQRRSGFPAAKRPQWQVNFLPVPPPARPSGLQPGLAPTRAAEASAAAAAIVTVAGGTATPAWASEGIQKVINIVTKGTDEFNDPSTPEGAKNLGLAFPIPTVDQTTPLSPLEFLPYLGIVAVAIGWGLFVVPSVMNRSDGAKSVLFAPKKEVQEVTAATAAIAATPIVKRLARPADDADDDDIMPKAKESVYSAVQGVTTKKSRPSAAAAAKSKRKKAGFQQ
mmetsp:Transcript_14521/g.36826  ORF Transcript_14521/g.36826 Transcript_14521/m.36826 type:complete len:260 (-) Transcript_14521:95-874(-)